MIISLFDSVTAAYTSRDAMLDQSWDEISTLLQEFSQVENKTDAMMFNLWVFDPEGEPGRVSRDSDEVMPGTIRRCSANALGVWGLVLDYDGGATIEDAVTTLAGYDYVLYTSFRHSDTLNKFRVVLPFTRMLTRAEFRAKAAHIREVFPNVDPASFSESQSMYLHSGPSRDSAISFRAAGVMLDPDVFQDTEVTAAPTVSAPVRNHTSEEVMDILDALLSHYPLLAYDQRFRVVRAVAQDLGAAQAINEMRRRWSDHNLNGKYEAMLRDPLNERSPTLGTVVHMIRQNDPNYRKPTQQQIIKKMFGGNPAIRKMTF